MSEGDANDLPKRPMPWETGATEGAPSGESAPPTPDAAPTEVVPTPGPPPAEAPPPSKPLRRPRRHAQPTATPPAAGLSRPRPSAGAPAAAGGPGPRGRRLGHRHAGRRVGLTGTDRPGRPGRARVRLRQHPTRLVAYLTDLFISWLIGFTIAAVVVAVLYSSNLVGRRTPRAAYISGVLVWVIALLFDLVYFVFFWSGGRRSTPGQRLFQIQVGNAVDGHQLDVTQAAVRWLGYGEWLGRLRVPPGPLGIVGLVSFAWPFLLLITTIISPTKQGLHDRIAGTWLVRPASADSSGLALGMPDLDRADRDHPDHRDRRR